MITKIDKNNETSAELLFSYIIDKEETYEDKIELYKINFNGIPLYQVMLRYVYYSMVDDDNLFTDLIMLGSGDTAPEAFRHSYKHDDDGDSDILEAEILYYETHKDEYSLFDSRLYENNMHYTLTNHVIWENEMKEAMAKDEMEKETLKDDGFSIKDINDFHEKWDKIIGEDKYVYVHTKQGEMVKAKSYIIYNDGSMHLYSDFYENLIATIKFEDIETIS